MHLKDPIKDKRRHEKQKIGAREYRKTSGYRATQIKYRKTAKYLATVRKAHLKRQYGLTPEQYDAMLASQNGLCAICSRPETSARWTRLSVDHNHTTKVLRGLLCHACNKSLGLMQDSQARLQSAIAYLNRYQQEK